MSVTDLLAAIDSRLSIAKSENEKLSRGIRSSAPKLRAALLEIGKSVNESRKLALDIGKAIPVKKRMPKEAEPSADPEHIAEPIAEPIAESMAEAISTSLIEPAAAPILAPKKRGAKKVVAASQPAA